MSLKCLIPKLSVVVILKRAEHSNYSKYCFCLRFWWKKAAFTFRILKLSFINWFRSALPPSVKNKACFNLSMLLKKSLFKLKVTKYLNLKMNIYLLIIRFENQKTSFFVEFNYFWHKTDHVNLQKFNSKI
jgi:hypothetical protein